ncbi:hypothetical protein D7X33_45345, partial [Butyricicoccus sp. 1XD8-22]
MAYKLKEMLVSPSKYSIKAPYKMNAEYITIHNTSNRASALNEARYHNSNNNQVSFHFAVDDKEVIQVVPTDRNAWHCGDGQGEGNRKSIGIEICYSTLGGEKYEQAEQNAVEFTAKLLHERGWNIDRVKTHKYWTQIGVKKGYSNYVKNCPHRILDEDRWDEFLERIQKELDKLNGKVSAKSLTDIEVKDMEFTSPTLRDKLEMRLKSPSTAKLLDD